MTVRIRTAVIPAGGLGTRAGVSAVRYDVRRFDCGNFAGLLQANIAVSQLDETPAAAPRPVTQPAEASAA